jgi:hypothetical protein
MVVTSTYASLWVLAYAQLVRGQRASSTGARLLRYDTHLFGARQRTLCAWRHALALCLLRKCSLYTANAWEVPTLHWLA